MIRLIHFSDIHLTAKPLGWSPHDMYTKRLTGWVNVKLLGRGKSFKQAPKVIELFMKEVREQPVDGLIFSGDATGMGFESEFAVAAMAIGVGDDDLPPAIAVPGNHDVYTRRSARKGYFEKYFGAWQKGIRIDEEHAYPFAQKLGHVWLIGVNSSTPNRWNWDASGNIDPLQLNRIEKLCKSLDDGPRIMVTHYPLRTATGNVEPAVHRLRDHRQALETARRCNIGLWLHGHIHRDFVLQPTAEIPFPIVCAGSTTQSNRMSYYHYTIEGHEVSAIRRVYEPTKERFVDRETYRLKMC